MDSSTIDRTEEDSHQEASHREEEDHLVSRWNSQKTPAFPLPLGLVSPKFPKRQVSAGLKMSSSPDRVNEPIVEGCADAPPLPPPCPLGTRNSCPPRIPMRKESVGMPLVPDVVGAKKPIFPPPLSKIQNPPKYPIRQESVGCKLLSDSTHHRRANIYQSTRSPSISPDRRIRSQAA
ncbi:expressed unknown protein [Seminavis robusta]|uniref:Uncharacterized protein n=1 Tax=Seminavis robusta TaxID=568900 RepID=A0A9N8D6N0_9STRA|nr:expressed unknown protein [Seminavis robusta]|eukprot:Sro20_g013960.1 n/a (177) ;mRNA; r:43827-44357